MPWVARFLDWLTRSNLVLILGVIIAATILTIMYSRITEPVATPTSAAEITAVTAGASP